MRALWFLWAGVAAAAAPAASEPVTLVREDGVFRLKGGDALAFAHDCASVLKIFVGDSAEALPVLGECRAESGGLAFRPKYPISPAIAARAIYSPPGQAALTVRFPAAAVTEAPTTHVETVYPTGSRLPANLLKFYVLFSASMQRGEAWRRVRLLDEATGQPIDLPFLELEQELWDRDNRRLTLLFDPGRIKRGVLPREQGGGALLTGHRYTLVVDADWRDARGLPMKSGFRKEFEVTEEDRTPLDAAKWKVGSPAGGSRDPLVIELPEPADHALLERLLSVRCGSRPVAGEVQIRGNEREWSFVPAQPWPKAGCFVDVDTTLEDLAGNKVGRAFDVDVFEKITKQRTATLVSLPLRIAGEQR